MVTWVNVFVLQLLSSDELVSLFIGGPAQAHHSAVAVLEHFVIYVLYYVSVWCPCWRYPGY